MRDGVGKNPFRDVPKYFSHALYTVLGYYQEPFSAEWDDVLNKLLDAAERKEIRVFLMNGYSIRLGGTEVWIGNEFYSYGYVYCIQINVKRAKYFNGPESDDAAEGDINTNETPTWVLVPEHQRFRPRFSTMLRLRDFVKQFEELARCDDIKELHDNILKQLKQG